MASDDNNEDAEPHSIDNNLSDVILQSKVQSYHCHTHESVDVLVKQEIFPSKSVQSRM